MRIDGLSCIKSMGALLKRGCENPRGKWQRQILKEPDEDHWERRMKREDFLFTIGYQGGTAIVDGQAKKRFGGLSTLELVEAGLFKPAFCSALFGEDLEEQRQVLEAYNRKSGASLESTEDLKRLFGVFTVPEEINKVSIV